MYKHCLVLESRPLSLLRLLKLMPPTLVTVVFLNNKFISTNLNILFVSIQVFGIQHNGTIVLLSPLSFTGIFSLKLSQSKSTLFHVRGPLEELLSILCSL
jgi:hypothetical protein